MIENKQMNNAEKALARILFQNMLAKSMGDEFEGIRADRIKPLIDWVNQCFPEVSTRSVVPWAGLRPMMPTMMPKVGGGSKPNVYYNTGHGHLGWTLSACTAEMIGDVIQYGETAKKLSSPASLKFS